MAGGDPVIKFTSCWIAFNAFYAQDTADSILTLERGLYRNYFDKILRLDRKRAIYGAIRDRSSGSVRYGFGRATNTFTSPSGRALTAVDC